MTLDAHQHFWNYDSLRHEWITPQMAKIRQDFMPEDLGTLLRKNDIEGCVAVQVDQTEEETLFLLGLADAHDFVKGVVGWVDFRDENVYKRLDYFSQFEKLKGFRHIVQAEPDDFLTRTDFVQGVRHLSEFDFSYDILIYPSQLAAAAFFVSQLPDVRFVVDHLAKPDIRTGAIAEWSKGIKRLASFPNVSCKISGMVTEADWQHWQPSDLTPYLDVVVEAFGTQRLMFGSDWPVCLVAAEYKQVKDSINTYFSTFSATEQQAVWGENARKFYKIEL
ncbi:amidohydrolase family protein [Arundinibacter roseus]|uniref:Amidohydrolase n=1 Tax=Arundinibacter roseus TaxID=2070510 RepID=A0A4R4KBR1_9BACT|nr:amidohydrolase family protein [Arundinibacter roseus]TDB65260.1 amidohydrolase [Arundinibacter roseus]